ncbi:MAG: Ig-like domain-containing protein [Bacteroidales bacterium]|nr:Ig-like domain-containing protein [Bacteroidales bacterium]
MKKLISLLAMAAAVLFTACNPVIEVTGVSLDQESLTLEIGQEVQLHATVQPADATDPVIRWQSSNPSCVTVSDGLVKAIAAGSAAVTVTVGTFKAYCSITVLPPEYIRKERAAMEAFYKSNNGTFWRDHTNWLSDRPYNEWYGVDVNNDGRVVAIDLIDNNVKGSIPKEIADLTELEWLQIMDYDSPTSEGSPLPEEIGQLKKLKTLSLNGYSLSGKLPESLFDLVNLERLIISDVPQLEAGPIPTSIKKLKNLKELLLDKINLTGGIIPELGELTGLTHLRLSKNNLTGSIPPELGALINLSYVDFSDNHLSGPIPTSFQKIDKYWLIWPYIFLFNDFTREDLINSHLPAPKSPIITGINGETIDIEAEVKKNAYTVFADLYPENGAAREFIRQLVPLYNANKDNGLEILTFATVYDEPYKETQYFRDVLSSSGATWKSFTREMHYAYPEGTAPFYAKQHDASWPGGMMNTVVIIGPDQMVTYTTLLDDPFEMLDNTISYLESVFDNPVSHYESKNYSADGVVTELQKASVGKGVDLVITGDAFSDRQISNGTFEKAAKQAVADLFSVEPMKSLKNRFNIYLVNAVSKNEEYFNGNNTVFSGAFGYGSAVGGNNGKVYEYAKKAVGDDARMDNVTVLVLMNRQRDGGTTYMADAEDESVFAAGPSVAWVPYKDVSVSGGISKLASTVVHEVAGHGIAKLADEYAYRDAGTIASNTVNYVKGRQKLNWYVNVDFTSDPNTVLWSRFVKDSNFSSEKIGAYEGGYTYWSGVWRPTEQSVMNNNMIYNNFNAPSRAQIYTRIMKLSEGSSWNFDYDTFVAWDKAHPAKASATRAYVGTAQGEGHSHAAPVATGKTWRETLNDR